MKFTRFAALLSAVFLCSSAMADSDNPYQREVPGYKECADKVEATRDIVLCNDIAAQYYDKKLNDNYKAAMKRCDERAADDGKAAAEQCKTKLKEAERAWIKYRDLMAAYLSQVDGGSVASMDMIMSSDFLADTTRSQAAYLQPMEEEVVEYSEEEPESEEQ